MKTRIVLDADESPAAMAVPNFFELAKLPTLNGTIGGRLEISGFPGWGILIQCFDPMGYRFACFEIVYAGAPTDAFPAIPHD